MNYRTIIIIFNLRTAAFKAYCAIWVRRSNFRLNANFHVRFRDLLHAVKLHRTDGFTCPPKEGVLTIFFALKFRRFRPGANPRTWVPKASTLTLHHRSRLSGVVTICTNYFNTKAKCILGTRRVHRLGHYFE